MASSPMSPTGTASTSSASGIPVSSELKSQFESAKRNQQTAFIKVQIQANELQPTHTERKGGQGWARDYDLVQRYLDDDVPCFIIFFKGREENILILYVPENATVKDKMSYSASKGALNTLVNARQFASTGASSGSSKQCEQIFATTKSEVTHRAYSNQASVQGPMSEVEEALQALPKQLDRKDFGKSMGYSLLATVSGKALPPQLANYASGNAAQVSRNLYQGSSSNFYARPSEAKAANKASVNRPPAGQGVLPGFGTAAKASSPTAASESSSSPSSSPTSSSSSSFGAQGRKLSLSSGKCLVATCENKRIQKGYCAQCLFSSEQRREAIMAGAED